MCRTTQNSQLAFFTIFSKKVVMILSFLLFMTSLSAATFPFTENFKDQNLTSRDWQWKFEERGDWRVRAKNLEIKSSRDTSIYEGRENKPNRGPSRNILVQSIKANGLVDFAVTAQINTSTGGQGGLILYHDNDNYIKLVIEKLSPYEPKEPFFVMLRENNRAVEHRHKEDIDIKGLSDIPGNDEIKVAIPGNKNRDTFIYDLRLRLQNKRVTMYWRVPGQTSWNRINESMPLPSTGGQWYAGIYSSGRSDTNEPQRYRNFGLTPGKCSLDADGSGTIDALTDGLLFQQHMFGIEGDALVDNTVATNCTRCDVTSITRVLDQCKMTSASDIDGNGEVDALTDGLLIIRYLFGSRGSALINGTVGDGCTRCSPDKIQSYIEKGL